MLVNFKKNYEKILLAILLVLLAASTVFALNIVTDPIVSVNGGTESPQSVDVPEILDHSISLKEYAGFLTSHPVVYCRNLKCNNLISKKFSRCTLCKTEIYREEKVNTDVNDNSIPDKIELSWGGRLGDPLNHFRDLDGDGFRNIDEYRANESVHDSKSHPLNLYRASFAGVENHYLPIVFSYIEKLEGKDGVKLYVSGEFKGKGGFYRSLNEDIYGIKVLAIDDEKSTVSVLYKNEVLVVGLKARIQVTGWP